MTSLCTPNQLFQCVGVPFCPAVQSSEVTFGSLTLSAQTLACLVPVSIEILEDSSNVAQIVQDPLMKAMVQKLDSAILAGS